MKYLAVLLFLSLASVAHGQTAVEVGATDQVVTLRLLDSDNAHVGSVAHGDVDCFYRRQGVAAAVAITEAAGTLGTQSDGGWSEDSDLEHYELGVPDAAFATGANWVIVGCSDASGTDFVAAIKDILLTTAIPEVDITKVAGSSVTGVSDLKADVSSVTVGTNNDKTGYSLSGSQTFSTTGTVGTVTTVSSPVTAGTVSDKTGYSLADSAIDSAKVTAAAANKIADHTLRRNTANIEDSSDGDTLHRKSLYGSVAQMVHKLKVLGGQMVTYRSDNTTELGSRDVTTDATAAPITELGFIHPLFLAGLLALFGVFFLVYKIFRKPETKFKSKRY